MKKTNTGQMHRPKLPGLVEENNQTIKQGEISMKRLTKGLGMMAMVAMSLFITVQKAGAQENIDTLVQGTAIEPTAVVAMAPVSDIQIPVNTQQTVSQKPLTITEPAPQAHKKAKNLEEVGNAIGFVIPAITMAGLVLLAML
jgi:hypothetical protein